MRRQANTEDSWLEDLRSRQVTSVAPHSKTSTRGNGGSGGTSSRVRHTALRWVDSSAVPEVHSSSVRPPPIRKDAGMCSPSSESLEVPLPSTSSVSLLSLAAAAASAASAVSREKPESTFCALPSSSHGQQQQQQQPAVPGPSLASRLQRSSPQWQAVRREPLAFITPPASRRNSVESLSTGTGSLLVSASGSIAGGVAAWVPPSPLRIPALPVPNPPPAQGQRRLTLPSTPPTSSPSHSTPSTSSGGEPRRPSALSARASTEENTAAGGPRATTTAATGTAVGTPKLPTLGSKRLSADASDGEAEQDGPAAARTPVLPPFRPLHSAFAAAALPSSASAALVASESGSAVTSGTPSAATLTPPPPPPPSQTSQPSLATAGATPVPPSPTSVAAAAAAAAAPAKALGVAPRVSPSKRTSGNTKTRPLAPPTAAKSAPQRNLQPPPSAATTTNTNTTTTTTTTAMKTVTALSTRQLATARRRRDSGGTTATGPDAAARAAGITATTPSSILSSLTSSSGSRFGAGGEWQALPVRRTNTSSQAAHAPTQLSPASSLAGGRGVLSPHSLALMPHLSPASASAAEAPARRGSLGSGGAAPAGLYAELAQRRSPSNPPLPGAGAAAVHDRELVSPLVAREGGRFSGTLRALPTSRASPLPTGVSRGGGGGGGGGVAGLPLSGISTGAPAALLSAVASARLASQATASRHDASLATPAVSCAGSLRLTSTSTTARPLEANVHAVFSGSAYADARSSPDLHVLRALPAVRPGANGFALPDPAGPTTTTMTTRSPSPPQPTTAERLRHAPPLPEWSGISAAAAGAAGALASPTATEAPPQPQPSSSLVGVGGAPSARTSPETAASVTAAPAPTAPGFLHTVGESGAIIPLPPNAAPLPPAPGTVGPPAGAAARESLEHAPQEPWSPTRVALAALLTSLSSTTAAAEGHYGGFHHAANYSTGSASSPNPLHLNTSSSRPDGVSVERSPPHTVATHADSHSSLRDSAAPAAAGYARSSSTGCRISGDSGRGGGDETAVNAAPAPAATTGSSSSGGGAVGVIARAALTGNNSPPPHRSNPHPRATSSVASSSTISVSTASPSSGASAALHDPTSLEHSLASSGPRLAATSHTTAAAPLTAAPPHPLAVESPPNTAPVAASALKFRSVLASSERSGRGARATSRHPSTSSDYADAAYAPEVDGRVRRAHRGRRSNYGSPSDDFTSPLQYSVGSPPAGGIRIGREGLPAKQPQRSHDRRLPSRSYAHRGSLASRREDGGAGSPMALGGRREPWVGLQLPRAVITPGLSFTKPAPTPGGPHALPRRSGHEAGSGVLRRTNSDICFGTFASSAYSFRSSIEERLSSFYNTTAGSASPPPPQGIDAELPASVALRPPSSVVRDSGHGSGSSPRSRGRVWQSSHRAAGSRPQSERGRSSGTAHAEFFLVTSPNSVTSHGGDDDVPSTRGGSSSSGGGSSRTNSSRRTTSSCASILSFALEGGQLISSPVRPAAAALARRASEAAVTKLRESTPLPHAPSTMLHARSQIILPHQAHTPTRARSWRSVRTGSTTTTASHPSVEEVSLLDDTAAARRRSHHQRASGVTSRSSCASRSSSERALSPAQRQMLLQSAALQHPRKDAAAAAGAARAALVLGQDPPQPQQGQRSPQQQARSAARAAGKHRKVVVLPVADVPVGEVSSADTGSSERRSSQHHPSQSQSPHHSPKQQSRRGTNFSSSVGSSYGRTARSFSR